ncbi:MAG: GTP-binding protein [Chlamydiae bacterium GWC2_50_10]|nr:MAG: GTP-binding protein [Chlamydiae bacterium GWC2_50_10]OGN57997.1 MAG: GTP-binding protein [Chlamydiae bacterium RIFCSPHIGHO2_02_FULL_49_29]OGN63175.1 MAG: GTP-binding protein [Chlamydiae bacterium RIFCSPHIGHO2_12_FULL_49_32]OGN67633.1 MAG: GTP-binding protein [Chlamydiae bacterium RIFCSPLOWO2_02_FULL_49_12]OGN70916.1 MAG: GTP-binding protein [Chlamydiae bacterium RIFCSPLOWO2_12_FULL_49_12]HBR18719.1 GTP-binding protein [Phycisphaerales bacterium]
MDPYIRRSLEPVLKRAAKEFPAVVLTGPRQAGKTTLLKHLFSASHRYLSLEAPDVRLAATSDPRSFIRMYPPPVIFDEIQYAPDLLFYVKEKIDEERKKYGQYVLTGSQNILLLQQVAESLAGRAAVLKLLPLSLPEIMGEPFRPFPWEKKESSSESLPIEMFWKMALRGSYPELIDNPEKDAALWQSSYIQTYLERDIRTIRQIGDLTQFQLFLRALAARSAQLFQLSDLSRDIGISLNTAKSWLAILEATYQVVVVRPYFANISKRLVKTPKIYFTDVGTLCYLTGLRDIGLLASGPLAGAVAETFVFSELFKRILHRGADPRISFWRTASGSEVDFIIEEEGRVIPLEVKASATPSPRMAEAVLSFRKDLGKKAREGYVVHLGDLALPLGKEVTALPFAHL